MSTRNWGKHNNQTIKRVTISDGKDCSASILTYGAVLQDLRIPDAKGNVDSITLGLNNIGDYVTHSPYMGAIVGRVANRIAFGRYTHDGQTTQLDINEPPHHLHGGTNSIDKRVWDVVESTDRRVTMRLTVPAFEDGYPGDLDVTCIYSFVGEGRLQIRLTASVSAACPINLAQHSYFNLEGENAAENSGSILKHALQVQADKVAVNDETNIPIDSLDVTDTPFDFRNSKPIDLVLDNSFQLQGEGLREVAKVTAPVSGRVMRLFSDQPELQVYTGHGLNLPVKGLSRRKYQAFDGLCLEPQMIPNAPNTPEADCFFGPNRPYTQTLEYRFETL